MKKELKDIETREDYSRYQKRVEEFFKRENIQGGFSLKDNDSEGYFSWQNCECCERPLGGTRYDVTAYNEKEKEVFEYSICEDCYYYAEYGQLDDMTMMKFE